MNTIPIAPLRRLWLFVLFGLVLAFLVLPIAIVVPMSFTASTFLAFPPDGLSLRWYQAYLSSPEWMAATRTSLLVAGLTTVLATPLGIAAAYAMRMQKRGTAPVRFVMLLPQMIPVILVAIGLFYVLSRLGLVNTVTGLVIGHSLLAIPFVFVIGTAGLASYDLSQEQVARSLGATRWTAFRTVTLPQIRLSVITGALLAFITSLDEVVISLLIGGGDATVLTRRMFLQLRDQIDPTIAAISSILIVLSTVCVLASGMVKRRGGV